MKKTKRFSCVINSMLAILMIPMLSVSVFAAENPNLFADEIQPAAFASDPSVPSKLRAFEVWESQGTKEIGTSLGVHRHTPYLYTYRYDDSRQVKATTTHTSNSGGALYGYTRARFESLLGGAITASDTGRQWRTGSSSAETAGSDGVKVGWSGIAKTYCGDSSTI